MNDELKIILEEAVVAVLTVLSQHFRVCTEKYDKKPKGSLTQTEFQTKLESCLPYRHVCYEM